MDHVINNEVRSFSKTTQQGEKGRNKSFQFLMWYTSKFACFGEYNNIKIFTIRVFKKQVDVL